MEGNKENKLRKGDGERSQPKEAVNQESKKLLSEYFSEKKIK